MNYSDAVRHLYYLYLTDQVPSAKISGIIKSVLKCFLPSLNTDELELVKSVLGTCGGTKNCKYGS